MIYLLDDRAIAEAFNSRPPGVLVAPLSDLVKDGTVNFTNDVCDAVKRAYKTDHCWAWLGGVKASRVDATVPWDDKQDVTDVYQDLVDPDSRHEPVAPSVIAQARLLIRQGKPVTIVTEDFGQRPLRMTLGEACTKEGITCIDTSAFLAAVGL